MMNGHSLRTLVTRAKLLEEIYLLLTVKKEMDQALSRCPQHLKKKQLTPRLKLKL